MSPEPSAAVNRSSARVTRNTKTVQAEVHCYAGDTELADTIAAAKAAFLDLDAFCTQVTEGELKGQGRKGWT